jgi:hypothetical protein
MAGIVRQTLHHEREALIEVFDRAFVENQGPSIAAARADGTLRIARLTRSRSR